MFLHPGVNDKAPSAPFVRVIGISAPTEDPVAKCPDLGSCQSTITRLCLKASLAVTDRSVKQASKQAGRLARTCRVRHLCKGIIEVVRRQLQEPWSDGWQESTPCQFVQRNPQDKARARLRDSRSQNWEQPCLWECQMVTSWMRENWGKTSTCTALDLACFSDRRGKGVQAVLFSRQ